MLFPTRLTLAAFCGVLLSMMTSCSKGPPSADKQLIVLGFDGMDPKLTQSMLDDGQLPHFARLAEEGGFRSLGTSTPPQSPVAWSTLITGTDPGKHGIFDFIHRDPKTYALYPSTTRTEEAGLTLPLGKWKIPLTGGGVTNLRHGKPFWDYLTAHGVSAHVYRMPANYPPSASEGSGEFLTLSDMGTPDLTGSQGTFSFYTTGTFDGSTADVSGGNIYRPIARRNVIRDKFYGPPDLMLAPSADGKPHKPLEKDFVIYRDPDQPTVVMEWDDHRVLMAEGEWSDWQTVDFEMGPSVAGLSATTLQGSFRMYVKKVRPALELYVTPIQVDPMDPALPISYPEDFSEQVASKIGRYFTQGLPEDTKALSHKVLNRAEFLQQAELVFDERVRLLDYALDRFKNGFLFFYFGSTDQVAHMFWGTMEPDHPAITPEARSRYHDVVRRTYERADAALGKVMERFPDATIICVSDHGFLSFARGFNLNTWLVENGYAAYKIDPKTNQPYKVRSNLYTLDLTKSRAYAIGINGLYINLEGRERDGIVPPTQKQALMDELCKKLLAVRDPKSGKQVIKAVYQSDKVYSPDHLDVAPDMQVGYASGYRGSWSTALGGSPDDLIEDNTDAWCGDHCVATDLVPGVVFSNRPLRRDAPTLEDVAPTILEAFGIDKPSQMKGGSLFARG